MARPGRDAGVMHGLWQHRTDNRTGRPSEFAGRQGHVVEPDAPTHAMAHDSGDSHEDGVLAESPVGLAEAGVGVGVGVVPPVPPSARVLSIQSHVVFGYVGNKSAVFPMQLHGFDVCPLNSVQFSNHTGYGKFAGQVLDGSQLMELVHGLEDNGLLDVSHVLTGYIGSASFLRRVVHTLKAVQKANPAMKFVCDPVLGDNGRLYVPEDLIPIYQSEVVPLATVLTPNQFECEQLSGVAITSHASADVALDRLHDLGVGSVLITSSSLGSDPTTITVIGSTSWDNVVGDMETWGGSKPETAPRFARFTLTLPKIEFHFTGTGDLTAALLLAWHHKLPKRFVTACERTVAAVQAVCQRTSAGLTKTSTHRDRELQVIASKRELEDPVVAVRAVPFSGATS